MAMTMQTEGLDALGAMIGKLGAEAQNVASGALYEGAGVMANAFSGAAGRIRTEPFTHKKARRLPSPEEKAAVTGKTGIAKFNKNGSEVNTLVGVTRNAGYVQLGKRRTPVLEIARSINSGTSFMTKQPIFRQAVSGAKGAAENAMVAKAEEMINDIING